MTPAEVEKVLLVARAQVLVTECPPNSNAGPKVEAYQAAASLTKGDPWCAAFVAYCGTFALGKGWPVPLYGGCASLGDWARKRKVLHETPTAGDVFLLHYPKLKRFAHTGFILGPQGTGWATVEGNTSGGGSREGWGVFERVRTFGPEDRFLRWAALDGKTP